MRVLICCYSYVLCYFDIRDSRLVFFNGKQGELLALPFPPLLMDEL